jgi:hypothetical protein
MAVESATDRAYFLESDDFGTTATFTSPALGSVSGIFDAETVEVDVGGDANILSAQPQFSCATSTITGTTEGSTVTIAGTNYKVKDRLDDGTGMSVLTLELA